MTTPAFSASTEALSAKQFFDQLSKDKLDLVDQFYDSTAEFVDPIVNLKGAAAIKDYYKNLYQDVNSIRFEYSDDIRVGDDEVLFWKMKLSHKKIAGGSLIEVFGNSHIKFSPRSKKVIYHRDYFDLGAFLYEHIPVLGAGVRFIKKRLQSPG